MTVEQVVQPHSSCHLSIDEAQEYTLLALSDLATEIGEGGRKRVRICDTEIVKLHGLPPYVPLLTGRPLSHCHSWPSCRCSHPHGCLLHGLAPFPPHSRLVGARQWWGKRRTHDTPRALFMLITDHSPEQEQY